MEREDYSNLEKAALLNAHYVAIMVDNDDRPDLDRIYLPVLPLNGGTTGWPLSLLPRAGTRGHFFAVWRDHGNILIFTT